MSECQDQFNELLTALHIPVTLPSKQKVAILKSLESEVLLSAASRIQHHQFRAVSDDAFVRRTLFKEIDTGVFAHTMRRRKMHLLIGECSDEHFVYGLYRTPANSMQSTFERFEADYSRVACDVLRQHYCPSGKLPDGCQDWPDAFGRIYADVQIHLMERGFVDALARHGAAELIHRYRIEWRAKCMDTVYPPSWGATHGSDLAIWFFGNGEPLSPAERGIVGQFVGPLARFLRGETLDWRTNNIREVRRLCRDGSVEIWQDELWEQGVGLWSELASVGCTGRRATAAL